MHRLDRFPRLQFAHLPTPLERLERLSASTETEIWVKRDDCTGLAFGGNKTRKLEFLLGEASAEGIDTVITIGGVQSNHARQTAAAAARVGMRCELILPRVVPREGREFDEGGNLLLDRLFGAHVFVVEDEAAAGRAVQARLADAAERGVRAVVHPPGGSTATGALGYANAASELCRQIEEGAPSFSRIYLAASTGGTLAGLASGFALAQREQALTGVCVAGTAAVLGENFVRLCAETQALLGLPPLSLANVTITDAFIGEGYGIPSAGSLDAIRRCALEEGLLLDPVYTGKAMAALLAETAGAPDAGPLLFWHTGGTPALFAYREELTA
jgi:D-cysteine desulfhydrase family pyridoxal phosphate-dependent enzyme